MKLNFSGAGTSNANDAISKVYARLSSWLKFFDGRFRERCLKEMPAAYGHMGKCLDLRRLANTRAHDDESEKSALCWLAKWCKEDGCIEIPHDDELWKQHLSVRDRLVKRAAELKGTRGDWLPSNRVLSGTVIMRELWQSSNLRSGASDWLTIFEACVIKSSNESVVESMGMIIDLHSAPGRHPDPEVCAVESFIHWNGPVLSRSRRMLTAALNLHFKGNRWNFTNTCLRGEKLMFKQVSLVVDRVQARPSGFQ